MTLPTEPSQESQEASGAGEPQPPRTIVQWMLDRIERVGNRLPDPAVLFLIGMVATWGLSAWLSGMTFQQRNPQTGERVQVVNLLTGQQLADFLAGMVHTFTAFPPLGVVLVAMLGVGVADASGMINVGLKELLRFTPRVLLSPMLLLVAVVSHTAVDAGYMLVIPIGGLMFYAAGRHPLAGIACAFAGVSGGFSANFIPSGLDPMLAGFTETGARVIDDTYGVNPLCNIYFTAASSLLVILVGWYLTDRVVEPRLASTPLDQGDEAPMSLAGVTRRDRIGLYTSLAVIAMFAALLIAWAVPPQSPLRVDVELPEGPARSLTSLNPPAPMMGAIVPLIFLFFIIPGIVHGFVSGQFTSHRDVIEGMKRSMESMGYYMVLVFFAALFIDAFTRSGLGILIALTGATALQGLGAPSGVTIVGMILLAALVNLFIGSASAKWGMLGPIFVPMLMLLGLSPELTQAAYRVGDSTSNIVTPMMPYFPLVVVYCQRYVKRAGVGTLGAMMLPYSVVFLVTWTLFLLAYWQLGLPLGLQAPYEYSLPG